MQAQTAARTPTPNPTPNPNPAPNPNATPNPNRTQGMRTNAAVVGATNGGDGAAAMQRELATARRDLAAMEAHG